MNAIGQIMLEQDYLKVAKLLSEEGVLFPRLEPRLLGFVSKRSADNLCRLIAFVLHELKEDPSIRPMRKRLLEERLKMMRATYLPRAN